MKLEIIVTCFTNADGYSPEQWPRLLSCPPQLGHNVVAKSGKRLKIVSINHLYDGTIELELHK